MSKRIAIVGAGAIGGYTAARMRQAGEDVTVIDAWPEHIEAIRRDGMKVQGMTAEEAFAIPIPAYHITDVQKLIKEKPIDVAFVSVKSYDTTWATQMILPYLAQDGVVVSLQNSINEETIAAVAGWGRTMGCCIGLLSAELIGPGLVQRNNPLVPRNKAGLQVGEVHGRVTDRARMVADLMRHVDAAEATPNLWGERWSKLVINSMRNGLSGFTGMSGRERDTTDLTLKITIKLGSVAVRVGRAHGFPLSKGIGYIEFDALAKAGEGDQEAFRQTADALYRTAMERSEDQRPSMGQDIRKGRRTETDAINGYVARKGVEIGLDAGIHQKVHELVQAVESGREKPSPKLAEQVIPYL